MARPKKQGIDCFPMECKFEENIEMYIAETGPDGFVVLVSAWQLIYQDKGYYIENNSDFILHLRRKIGLKTSVINGCINECIRRNIFNKFQHLKYGILTSKSIQERYFLAARKKKTVSFRKEFILSGVKLPSNGIAES